jgi:hypothetical protein
MQINDRYEFPLQLDLDREDGKYLSPDADRSVRNHYTLHRSAKFPFFCIQKELFSFSVMTVSYFKPCMHSLHGEYCRTHLELLLTISLARLISWLFPLCQCACS